MSADLAGTYAAVADVLRSVVEPVSVGVWRARPRTAPEGWVAPPEITTEEGPVLGQRTHTVKVHLALWGSVGADESVVLAGLAAADRLHDALDVARTSPASELYTLPTFVVGATALTASDDRAEVRAPSPLGEIAVPANHYLVVVEIAYTFRRRLGLAGADTPEGT